MDVQFAMIWLQGSIARARRLQREDERGASVLEWAMIAAVVVMAATVIGAVVIKIVNDKSATLEKCANTAPSASC